jgi:prolipoprotein diacylglyceryl transferase
VPIINRPVAWYGLLFALGFILGFIILQPILRRKLSKTKELTERDIASWQRVICRLKKEILASESPLFSILDHLSKKTKEIILSLQLFQEPDRQVKQEILGALNVWMQEKSNGREKLPLLIPKGIFKIKDLCYFLSDRLTWFVVIGTIVGSRLGHVFFYEWPHYRDNPLDIIKIWEGGLASHGGVIGVILALTLFQRTIRRSFPELHFVAILDCLSIPSALVAVCIRLGNFFNQEITGPETTVPWAVTFANPVEWTDAVPRHPTQLYEALVYLLIFVAMFAFWKIKGQSLKSGTLIGALFIAIFSSRFFLEYFKAPSSMMIDESTFFAGQILSIPFILFGAVLLFLPEKKHFLHAK